jgi:hypothetical protein
LGVAGLRVAYQYWHQKRSMCASLGRVSTVLKHSNAGMAYPNSSLKKPRSGEWERAGRSEEGEPERGIPRGGGERWAHSRILEMSSPSIFVGPGGMRGDSRLALAELKSGVGRRRGRKRLLWLRGDGTGVSPLSPDARDLRRWWWWRLPLPSWTTTGSRLVGPERYLLGLELV